MTPDDQRHGKVAGYVAGCRESCCRDAVARYECGRQLDILKGHARTVPGVGTARRVQALAALGWSYPELAKRLGLEGKSGREVVRRYARTNGRFLATTAARVDRLYRELCMTPPPQSTPDERYAYRRALNAARRHGWVPPLAWDDIDNDPAPVAAPAREGDIDHAVVERMLASGERVRKLTAAEAEEVCRRALARGMSTVQIRELYSLKVERYVRLSDPEAVA